MHDGAESPVEGTDLFAGMGGPLPSQIKPPGRPVWRIIVGGVFLLLGGATTAGGIVWAIVEGPQKWMIRSSIAVGAAVCGLGFAVYDARWPFGPKRKGSLRD